MAVIKKESARRPLIRGIFDVSGITLIISNIITIFLAVTGGWSLRELMIVYWAQSVIIGLFVFLKILCLKNFSTENFKINDQPVKPTKSTKNFTAGFFLLHYGIFHFVYFIFLVAGSFEKSNPSLPVATILSLLFSITIFFADHLFSFIYNYEKDSNKKKNIGTLMFFPYARIIPMHLTIVFGIFLIESNAGLVFFLILKTIADVIMHAVEHRL